MTREDGAGLKDGLQSRAKPFGGIFTAGGKRLVIAVADLCA